VSGIQLKDLVETQKWHYTLVFQEQKSDSSMIATEVFNFYTTSSNPYYRGLEPMWMFDFLAFWGIYFVPNKSKVQQGTFSLSTKPTWPKMAHHVCSH
jgi:hypothetical protein